MLDYTLTINGVDFTNAVQYESYETKKVPVYSRSVVTIDGVEHVALLRNKNEISFRFNPQNATVTNTLADALLSQPCLVYFFSLQTQTYETARMKLNEQSANYLVRCKAYGLRWNQSAPVQLEEL